MAKPTKTGASDAFTHRHLVRFDDQEIKIIDDDIKEMVAGGLPRPKIPAYCKHAALNYARLRRIEAGLRAALVGAGQSDAVRAAARKILESGTL